MAETSRVIEALLRYSIDASGISKISDANRRVIQLLDETKRTTLSTSQAADLMAKEYAQIGRNVAIDNLINDLIRAGKETKDWKAQIDAAAASLSRLGGSEAEVGRVTRALAEAQGAELGSSSFGQRTTGALGRFGREVRALPAIQLSGSLSTDAIGKILYTADAALGSLGATAGQVAGAAGLAAPALIALVIAMNNFNATIEASKANLAAALSAQEEYYDALATSTSEEVQARIEEIQRSQPVIRQQITELQNAVNSTFTQMQQNFGDAVARALVAAGKSPTGQLEEELKALQETAASNEQTIVRLNQGLLAGVFAANDMRAAEEELARKREDEAGKFLSDIEAEIRETARFNDILINGTREQKLAELERLQQNQQIADAQLAAAERQAALAAANPGVVADLFSEEDLQELRNRSSDLAADIATLAFNLTSTDFAAASVSKQARALSAALGDMADVQGVVARTTAEAYAAEKELAAERKKLLADNALETNKNLVEAQAEYAELVREDAAADLEAAAELARKQRDIQDAITEVERDAADKRADIAEKAAADQVKINRDLAKSERVAARERSVTDAITANERATEQKQELKERGDEQLRQVEKTEQRKTDELRRSGDKQLADLQNKLTQENNARQQALNLQIVLINNYNAGYRAIQLQMQNASLTQWQQYWDNYWAIQQEGQNRPDLNPASQTSSATTVPPALLPGQFGPQSTSQTSGQTSQIVNLTLNVNGTTAEQRTVSRAEAMRVVEEVFSR